MDAKTIVRTIITTFALIGFWLSLLVGGPVGLSYASAVLKLISGV